MFRWINGRDPRQYGLDFGLWTRSVVANLIEQQFRIERSGHPPTGRRARFEPRRDPLLYFRGKYRRLHFV